MADDDLRDELRLLRSSATDLENELFMLQARLRRLERMLPHEDAVNEVNPLIDGPSPDVALPREAADVESESVDAAASPPMPEGGPQPSGASALLAWKTSVKSPPPPAFRPSAVSSDDAPARKPGMEEIIGQRWLNRAGAVILFLALAFFVKYSFDRGLISPTLRVVLGGVVGGLLIAIGEYCVWRSMRQFSMGLLGAGVGVLYLAVFGAYNFYHLVSPQTASILYIAVTFLSVVVAVHGDMLVVAILALLGGYVTPIALSTGTNAQVALLTYVLFLDVGFLVCAQIRRWDVVRLLAWLGTLGLFGGWFFEYYAADARWTTWGFLLGFYLLFHGEILIALHRGRIAVGWLAAAMLRAENVAFFGGTYLLWRETAAAWLGLFAVLAAGVQWLAAVSLRREGRPAASAKLGFWLDGAAMLALAAPLQFDRYLVSISWSVQAVITFGFCRRCPDRWLRVKATGVLAAALVHLYVFERDDALLVAPLAKVGLWYWSWLIMLFVGWALCAYASAGALCGRRACPQDDRNLGAVLLGAASGVFLWTFAEYWERYIATWWWLGLAAGWLGLTIRWRKLAWLAGGLLLLVLGKTLFWDLGVAGVGDWRELHGIVANRAVLTGVLVAIGLLAADWILLRDLRGKVSAIAPSSAPGIFVTLSILVVVWTGTFEVARVFRYEAWASGHFADAETMGSAAIIAYWLLVATALWLVPRVGRSPVAVFAIVLAGLAFFRVLVVDTLGMAMSGHWARLSGVCVNRVFIVGMFAALAAWVCYRRVRRLDIAWLAPVRAGVAVVALLAVAVLVTWVPTFEIARVFRYEPLGERFADARLAMHVGLSVLWSLNATVFLAVGFLRRLAPLRYAALVLYLATVVKVFVVDLSHLDMMYRIVSFMVLGMLLILGSLLYQKYAGRLVPLVGEREKGKG